MKKIFCIAAAALIAFGFASCKKNGGNTPDGPTKPDEPTKGAFAITVSNITATEAHVKIVPESDTIWYFWSVVGKDDLAEYQMTLEQWAEDDMSFYPEQGYTFDEMASKGTTEYDVPSLNPESEYYVYAFKFNKEFKILGEIVSKEFKTAKFEIIGSETLNLSDADYAWEYEASSKAGYLTLYGHDAAKNLELGLLFLIKSDNPNGTFTEADMDEPYADYGYYLNYLYDDTNEIEYRLVSANVTGAFNADKSLYIFSGEAVALNGIKYSFKDVQAVEYQEPEDDGGNWFAPARVRSHNKGVVAPREAKKLFVR